MMLWYLSLFSLWLRAILCFYTAFLHQSYYFFCLGKSGASFSSVVVVCSPPSFTVWAWTYLTRWKQTHRVCTAWGRGAASSICVRMINTSQTLSLALIGCVEPGAVDSCKSNYGHWVEPQIVDFYTADLYLILLSDHNYSFSKDNKKIVTDYSFKCDYFSVLITPL